MPRLGVLLGLLVICVVAGALVVSGILPRIKAKTVLRQETSLAAETAAARVTAVKSAEANVKRLEEMVSFERIYVPFDGVVTARNTDIGQLIASGSAVGQNRELFHVAAIYKLRVFVNVPQTYSHATT